MEEYLNAPAIAPPLRRFDCVPVVSGASALVLSTKPSSSAQGSAVRVSALGASFNYDHQNGDGLQTGIRQIAADLWKESGVEPSDMDLASAYDDYPAMVFAQLADLGIIANDEIGRFSRDKLSNRQFPVNTGGGMLSGGQPGMAGGLHGIVEVVRQLQWRGGARQVPGARRGVASGYGMVLYRYCASSGAAVFERLDA
jgi:acetyl-CoA acetyltransferase